jgi:hypothetical protein
MSKNDSPMTFAQIDFICDHKNSYALILKKSENICDANFLFLKFKT